jgi:hypothetical protein
MEADPAISRLVVACNRVPQCEQGPVDRSERRPEPKGGKAPIDLDMWPCAESGRHEISNCKPGGTDSRRSEIRHRKDRRKTSGTAKRYVASNGTLAARASRHCR